MNTDEHGFLARLARSELRTCLMDLVIGLQPWASVVAALFSNATMQLAERRRLGGSTRGKSVLAIRTSSFDSPIREHLGRRNQCAPAPGLDRLSRRDGGAPVESFRRNLR